MHRTSLHCNSRSPLEACFRPSPHQPPQEHYLSSICMASAIPAKHNEPCNDHICGTFLSSYTLKNRDRATPLTIKITIPRNPLHWSPPACCHLQYMDYSTRMASIQGMHMSFHIPHRLSCSPFTTLQSPDMHLSKWHAVHDPFECTVAIWFRNDLQHCTRPVWTSDTSKVDLIIAGDSRTQSPQHYHLCHIRDILPSPNMHLQNSKPVK